ncbi:MAG: nuclear transport factor 2 family protein [Candidatus Sumerlaeia bacterium]|nr:nuclear transport factor 2 family protein [Candidatus Sumerlaeia bacterium]
MEELRQALLHYLECYLVKRDISLTLALFTPLATGYGTGIDEIAYDFSTLGKLYLRDISQAPDSVQYTITNSHFYSPADNLGIVSCELNFRAIVLQQEVKLNGLRLSLMFVKTEGKWLIAHMHISLPTTAHEAGEAYPIKELEERNKVLSRMVKEKTEELLAANEELKKRIDEISTLRGLLPICASCKRIRDDKDIWHNLEAYISAKSAAKFSHGICPECAKKLYPNYLPKE